MNIPTQEVARMQTLLQEAERVLVVCHKNPDGDAIGALIGMGLLVERAYPGKEVLLHCLDPVPETFHFLSGSERIQPLTSAKKYDVLVFVDSAEPKLTGYDVSHPHFFDGSIATINIDHHPTNSKFASANVVMPDTCSACEIVFEIAEHLQWEITSDSATALLTGVLTDTGGLVHSNTTADVYRVVARLMRRGARRQEVVQHVFRTAKLSTLKLWGRVLEKIQITPEGGAISAVTEEDFRAVGAHHSELTGAIDYVNAVPGMRFSCILSERDGKVKGSLRTLREDVDVAKMASKFDGGGHTKAAGFALSGKLKPEVRWKVVDS